jgi:hypothetical protein
LKKWAEAREAMSDLLSEESGSLRDIPSAPINLAAKFKDPDPLRKPGYESIGEKESNESSLLRSDPPKLEPKDLASASSQEENSPINNASPSRFGIPSAKQDDSPSEGSSVISDYESDDDKYDQYALDKSKDKEIDNIHKKL